MDAEGNSTNVTWAVYGPQRYLGKVKSMFFNMDNLMGKEFEAGLAKMKTTAESQTVVFN